MYDWYRIKLTSLQTKRYIMLKYFKLFLLIVGLASGLAINAQEGPKGPPKGGRPPKPELTETQKKLQIELLQKYDVDKKWKIRS